jgi:hypothetical protein
LPNPCLEEEEEEEEEGNPLCQENFTHDSSLIV